VQNSVFLHYDNKYFLTLDEHIITIGELDFDLYEQISNSTKIYTKYITQLNFYIHNTTGIHASAVFAVDTVVSLLDTADHLPCAGTRQSGHGSDSDGRGCLPCARASRTRQSVPCVLGRARQNKVTSTSAARQGGAPLCRVPGWTRQSICRVPCLPCVFL
jgi:hypothetical protein